MNVLEASMLLGGTPRLMQTIQSMSTSGPNGRTVLAAVARGWRPRVQHMRVSEFRSVGLYRQNRRDFSSASHTKMKPKWAKLGLPSA